MPSLDTTIDPLGSDSPRDKGIATLYSSSFRLAEIGSLNSPSFLFSHFELSDEKKIMITGSPILIGNVIEKDTQPNFMSGTFSISGTERTKPLVIFIFVDKVTLTKLPLGTSTMNQYQQYYQIVRVTSHDTVPPDQETAWMARESETVPQSTIDDRMDIVNNNDGFYYLSVRLPNEPTTPPGEAPQFTIFWAAQIGYEYP